MVSQEFADNVRAGDVVSVRSALLDDLIVDRSFQQFDEELSYAKSQGMPVIETHDGAALEPDTGKWDMRYLNRQKAALMVNFSDERIKHLKEVIIAVMGMNNAEPDADLQIPSNSDQRPNSRTGRRIISVSPAGTSHGYHKSSTAHDSVSPSGQSSRTGRKTISEEVLTPDDNQPPQKSSFQIDYKKALMAGGAATFAVGAIVSEPVIMGVGAAAAGVGVVMTVAEKRK